jgi:hypothetical protein
MRAIAILTAALISASVSAQEYKPYPRAQITEAQWQAYFDEVAAKHGATRREFPAEHLMVFEDTKNYMSYAFTQPGHPAHPAWVTRHVVQDAVGVNVRQIGYFAGEEVPFAKLFRAYQELNARMREDFQRRSREGK